MSNVTKAKALPPLEDLLATFYVSTSGEVCRKIGGRGFRAGPAGGKSKGGYIYIRHAGQVCLAHRIVYYMAAGVDPLDAHVDHINGDRADNRIANLRLAGHAENGQHRVALDARNTSGYRGVYWSERDRRWIARVTKNKKMMHVSYHRNVEEAAIAAASARKSLLGHYAGITP